MTDPIGWRPTVAFFRVAASAAVLIAGALVWRRPDLLVIATPAAMLTVWSTLTRPSATPAFDDNLVHPTIREGDATTWRGELNGARGLDLALATLDDSPWIDARPASGVVTTAAAADGSARLAIGLRSARWGVRPVGRIHVVGASSWASFRWAVTARRHSFTTLPLPAVFDANAASRPSNGLVGVHRSLRAGEGNEFAGIRPFQPGDRMRRINWARSMRTTELQVNSTWADLDTHIALIVDATDDFGVSEGIDGKASSLDRAVRAAGAIAEQYAVRGERVSVRAFGTTIAHTVRPGSGRMQLRRILDSLARMQPSDMVRTRYRTSAAQQRGVVGGQITIMLSPLIDPEALDLAVSLARRGMAVIVIDTLPSDVALDDDQYTALAWRLRLLERRREVRMLLTAGIPIIEWRGPGSLDQVIRDISHRSTAPRMLQR